PNATRDRAGPDDLCGYAAPCGRSAGPLSSAVAAPDLVQQLGAIVERAGQSFLELAIRGDVVEQAIAARDRTQVRGSVLGVQDVASGIRHLGLGSRWLRRLADHHVVTEAARAGRRHGGICAA